MARIIISFFMICQKTYYCLAAYWFCLPACLLFYAHFDCGSINPSTAKNNTPVAKNGINVCIVKKTTVPHYNIPCVVSLLCL